MKSVLFAREDVGIGGRILERVNVLLGNEEGLLGSLHADEVDAEFIDNGSLFTSKGREAGYLGIRVAGHRRVFDELRRANFILEKACDVVCQN